MKKRLLFLLTLGFLISGCGVNEPPIGEDSNPNIGEEENPDDDGGEIKEEEGQEEENNPDITPFSKISELISYVNNDLVESREGISFVKQTYTYGYSSLYSFNIETTNLDINSYSNDITIIEGETSTFKDYPEDDYFEDETTSDSFISVTSIIDNSFYQAIDYLNNNDLDNAEKVENIEEKDLPTFKENLYPDVDSQLSMHLADYAQGKFVTNGSSDSLSSVVDTKTGNFSSSFTLSWNNTNEYGKYVNEVNFEIDFLKNGSLAGFLVEYNQFSYIYENGDYTEETELISTLKDEVKISYDTKTEYDFKEINPLDYFLTDYKISVYSLDTIMSTLTEEDSSQFPLGEIIEVKANECVPLKALDTKLEIESSSDSSVISESHGQFKAVGEGKTTLNVFSENGIKKSIEVKVVAPSLERVNLRINGRVHLVGETETLYIDYYPENTLDEFYLVNKNNDLVSITEIEDLLSGTKCVDLTFLNEGTATIEVYKTSDDSLLSSIQIEISSKITRDEAKNQILGTWIGDLPSGNNPSIILEDAIKIEFLDETTGRLTILKENTGYTLTINQPYEFTYNELAETRSDCIEFSLSSIDFYVADTKFSYDSNRVRFYLDGKTLLVSFTVSDPNYYGFSLEFYGEKMEE